MYDLYKLLPTDLQSEVDKGLHNLRMVDVCREIILNHDWDSEFLCDWVEPMFDAEFDTDDLFD